MIVRMVGGVALVLLALVGVTGAGAQEPRVIGVPEKDAAMAAAISQARAALSHFWQRMEKPAPDEGEFALKVGLPTGRGGAEHIWANNVERKDGKIFGTINNVPKYLRDMRLGQRIEIPEPLISDWMYHRSGKIVGGYTIRVLLPRLPREEAARLRAMLAEP